MKRTAYLHPLAAEELSLLPADSRPRFYAQILSRLEQGAKEPDVEFTYPFHEDFKPDLFTSFHTITSAPEFIASLDTRIIRDGFVYLHVTNNPDDHHLLSTAQARRDELRSGKVAPLPFDDFMYNADLEEIRIAQKIITAEAVRNGNRVLLKQSNLDAKTKTAFVFNMPNKHMESFQARIDFYLDNLNELLEPFGAKVTFTASFSSGEIIHFTSLKDISHDVP